MRSAGRSSTTSGQDGAIEAPSCPLGRTLGGMGWVFEEPSVVLVCITLAAILFLIEVALPTVGVAGTAALVRTAIVGSERMSDTRLL